MAVEVSRSANVRWRRTIALIGEHVAVLAVGIALWFGSLFVDALLRFRFDTPIIPARLVLFLLAFAMTVRVRNPSLTLLVALAWLGSGLYFYVVDRHSSASHYGDRLARYSLAWSIEMALIFVTSGGAGMLWLRRTSTSPPKSIDQPAG